MKIGDGKIGRPYFSFSIFNLILKKGCNYGEVNR